MRRPRLVLITGASSGIGWALAQACLQRDCCVALLARRDAPLRERLLQQGWATHRWQVWSVDVTDPVAMQRVAGECMASMGLPDIVVANAGISLGVDTAEFEDLAVFEQVMRTNVLGVVHTFHPFIDAMRQRGSGQLVGIASVAGIRGLPGHGAYCASKSAVMAYCESLRGELAPHGLQVGVLVPGYVATPLTERNRYPMPFLMSAQDFADQALRAIDSGASYRVIPWQMGLVARCLRLLPDAWLDRLLRGRTRKHRHNES